MGGKSPATVTPPKDPDPSPTITSDPSAEVQASRREEKKRNVGTYGRHRTILAGNTSTDNQNKKTILGG